MNTGKMLFAQLMDFPAVNDLRPVRGSIQHRTQGLVGLSLAVGERFALGALGYQPPGFIDAEHCLSPPAIH
jgi:hypothetical protein